jgi:glycosyltransferase involved in cell wall biosynthesis
VVRTRGEPDAEVVIVGHPFAPSGRGRNTRSMLEALRAAGVTTGIYDLYHLEERCDQAMVRAVEPYCVTHLSTGINLFVINGDEVEQALTHLAPGPPAGSYNIIYPAWELAHYPAAWATCLERFDEVWAQSLFTREAIAAAVKRPVVHMGEACQAIMESPIGRRQFSIEESAFVFLSVFDFSSYMDRKNPLGSIEAFTRLCTERPLSDVRLVLKTDTRHGRLLDLRRFKKATANASDRVHIIDCTLQENEIINLIHSCDCFLSLHRAEGFGHALSEAMYLGKPVIATGYSGNLDFMDDENCYLVDYDLVSVRKDQYIFSELQVWAEPHIDQAVRFMCRLIDHPDEGRELGIAASRHIRQFFSYRAIGLRYRARLEELQAILQGTVRRRSYAG